MTKKKETGGRQGDEKASANSSGHKRDIRWVNPHCTKEDISWLEGNPDDSVADLLSLCETLSVDERLSSKYDIETGRWLAVLFDDSGAGGTPVNALSCRGATAFDALLVVAYFAVRKDGGNWKDSQVGASSRFGQ